jgi:hypothetical protein
MKAKCVYKKVCTRFGSCPPNRGDKTEDYSCLDFKDEREAIGPIGPIGIKLESPEDE